MLLARSRTSRRAFLAIALLAACGGGGDDAGTTPPTTGTVSGRVATGSESVAGATVTLSGGASRTTTTNNLGNFSFTALAPGAYSVAVTLPAAFALATGEPASRNATVAAGQTATVNWTALRT